MELQISLVEIQTSDYKDFEQFSDPKLNPYIEVCVRQAHALIKSQFENDDIDKNHLGIPWSYHVLEHTEFVTEVLVSSAVFLNKISPGLFAPRQISLLKIAGSFHDVIQDGQVGPETAMKLKRNCDIKMGMKACDFTDEDIEKTNEYKSWQKACEVMKAVRDLDGNVVFTDEDMLFIKDALMATYVSFVDGEEVLDQIFVDPNSPVKVIMALSDLANTYGNIPENVRDADRLFFEENLRIARKVLSGTNLSEEDVDAYSRWIKFQARFIRSRQVYFDRWSRSSSSSIRELLNNRFNNISALAQVYEEIRPTNDPNEISDRLRRCMRRKN